MKMIAVAPHHRFVQPMLASCISFGVGCYCFIHTTGNARAGFQDKADIVPTPSFLFIAFIWELGSKTKNKLKMKIFRMIGMALFAVFMCVNFISCEKNEIINEEENEIPTSFNVGNQIHFDGTTYGYGFHWLIVKSPSKCQWVSDNQYEDGMYINPQFSSATYTYEIIGENQAILTSRNYQAMSGRTWTISTTMSFKTNKSGTFTSKEINLNSGTSQSVEGTFEIK